MSDVWGQGEQRERARRLGALGGSDTPERPDREPGAGQCSSLSQGKVLPLYNPECGQASAPAPSRPKLCHVNSHFQVQNLQNLNGNIITYKPERQPWGAWRVPASSVRAAALRPGSRPRLRTGGASGVTAQGAEAVASGKRSHSLFPKHILCQTTPNPIPNR